MKVRAKFVCNSVHRSLSSRQVEKPDGTKAWEPTEIQTVKMSPVYGNGDPSHENTKFWNATPSGSVELGCINLDAAQSFELGKEYYLDFTPAS